jgi:hypothetical protein
MGGLVQSRRKWFMDEKVKNILAEALQASNPEERRAWLERACVGDDELRREVESLLKAYGHAGDSFEHTMPLPEPDDIEFACPNMQTAGLEKQTVQGEPREGRFSGMLTRSFWGAQRSETKEFELGNRLARYMDGSLYNPC